MRRLPIKDDPGVVPGQPSEQRAKPNRPAAANRSKATGKVVDTRDGDAARGELNVEWSGVDSKIPEGVSCRTATTTGRCPSHPRTAWDSRWRYAAPSGSSGSPARHDHVGPGGLPDGTGGLRRS